jgi:hypothetical protein
MPVSRERPLHQLGAEEAKLPRAQPSRQSTSAHKGSPGRIAPGGESVITRSPILTGGKTVTAELEVVVDRSVNGEKLLGMPDRLEPLHVTFSPSGGLVRDLTPGMSR